MIEMSIIHKFLKLGLTQEKKHKDEPQNNRLPRNGFSLHSIKWRGQEGYS